MKLAGFILFNCPTWAAMLTYVAPATLVLWSLS